jgi:hypothetical protein
MPAIYKITFPDNQFYIGKTTNYARRVASHINTRGKGSPKLEAAFKLGDPVFEVLKESSVEELDLLEQYYIKELKPTLNVLPGGETLSGLNHPRSKYTRAQILEVVRLFLHTDMKYSGISELTGVKQGMVHDVCKRRAHIWATEGLADLDIAAARRKSTHKIYSPDNTTYEADTLAELSELTGLTVSTLNSIRKSKKFITLDGWSLEPKSKIKLIDPLGHLHELFKHEAKGLLENYCLSRYQINQLLNKKKPSADWRPVT